MAQVHGGRFDFLRDAAGCRTVGDAPNGLPLQRPERGAN